MSDPVPEPLCCSDCGYALRGLPSNGCCPECGRAIAETVERLHTLTLRDTFAIVIRVIAIVYAFHTIHTMVRIGVVIPTWMLQGSDPTSHLIQFIFGLWMLFVSFLIWRFAHQIACLAFRLDRIVLRRVNLAAREMHAVTLAAVALWYMLRFVVYDLNRAFTNVYRIMADTGMTLTIGDAWRSIITGCIQGMLAIVVFFFSYRIAGWLQRWDWSHRVQSRGNAPPRPSSHDPDSS